MARGKAGIWRRKGRPGWYAWINHQQVLLGTGTEREALDRWHELSGRPADRPEPDTISVRVQLNKFLDHLQAVKRKDYGWYQTRIASFSESIPPRLALSALRPKHVTEWIREHDDWSPTYAAGAIGAVQTALNWHVSEGTLEFNPIAKVKKPKRERREFTYSKDQIAELIKALPEPAKTFIRLVAETGCRPSEMAAARGSDVASDAATITVRKSKTGRARTMPVPKSLRPLVAKLAKKAKGELLCSQTNGNAWHRTAWSRAMLAARSKAGLPDEADVYALRHTWITHRLEAGESLADVAMATGTSIAMISKHYAHLKADRTRALADRL